jgi:acyl-CoA thioesterase-1
MILKPSDHIVFFGDSVTDCDRDRTDGGDRGLGLGYVRICQALLQAKRPDLAVRVTNRGISGDRIYDLEARLERDVLAEFPDVVSILIGINDTWQRYGTHQRASPVPEFAACYRRILRRLQTETRARLVLCEPFVLPVPEDRAGWREDLDPRIRAVRELAGEFGAAWLPLDGCFAAAARKRPPEFWLPDGVHPSAAGHGVIATAWLDLALGEEKIREQKGRPY